MLRGLFLAMIVFSGVLAGCDDASDNPSETTSAAAVDAAREACVAAAGVRGATCEAQCSRLADAIERTTCESACDDSGSNEQRLCAAPLPPLAIEGGALTAQSDTLACREDAESRFDDCASECAPASLFCATRCEQARAEAEQACGFLPAAIERGGAALQALDPGRPATLSLLLDETELALVEEADERARTLRARPIRLWTGNPGTPVEITQVQHAFRFGVPLDIREFQDEPGRLDFYGQLARPHTNLLVAETSLKWRNAEPEEGEPRFDLADAELAWAESLGYDVKAHVLLWGNAPPLSSGSGTPEWLRDKFPDTNLSAKEQAALRELIRARIADVVGRYSGRIDVWEVTNEMLNPITPWFADRLGPGIVDDAFRWAREADPGAELVYNEWISDIFTGVGGPDATAVRDRVIALKNAGVPVDALGQQGHFAPGLVNIGVEVDLSQRTRIDDYARALDTLAEAGLPIHITEVTFAAPDEPELRAAQAEAVMRLWWGHPQVEEIIFWNFWNPLGPRSHLDLGVFDEGGNLSRHGEAILSLLNDRWRTRVSGVTDQSGSIELSAVHGDYVAQWQGEEGPVHVRFSVSDGPGTLRVFAVEVDD